MQRLRASAAALCLAFGLSAAVAAPPTATQPAENAPAETSPLKIAPPEHSAAAEPSIDRNLLTIARGDAPIILSAPHGGRLPIPGAKERANKDAARFVTVRDENTSELAEAAAAEFHRLTGRRVYLVIARFERKYLDVNRAAADAYESEAARAYYEAYHQALSDFCREAQDRWRGGLLLDIHGQKVHPDHLLRGTSNGRTVTLLRERRGEGAIVGPHSVFGMMDAAGYQVLPKLDSSDPEVKNYSGGYTVVSHGSHDPAGVDAMQLEFGNHFRVPKDAATKSGHDLARAIEAFCQEYYPKSLPAPAAAK